MADLVITANSVRVQSAVTATPVQFGEAVTPGQVVYRQASNNKYYLSDCDLDAEKGIGGLVLSHASADDYGYIFNSRNSLIDLSVTLTTGTAYVVSDTAGNIMPDSDLTTGQYLSIIGYGDANGLLSYQPNVTGLQKP